MWKRDRRGNITLIAALVAPALVMLTGIGVEVVHWTAVSNELQRTADIAALAGGTHYLETGSAINSANAAADVAELNGASGSTDRIWNATTQALSDNQITVQIGSSVRNSNNTGVEVTVTQTVPLVFTRIFSSLGSVSIGASGWVQVTIQPCVLALNASGSGVTAKGSSSSTLSQCSIRSNSSISTQGPGTISAYALYADTTISGSVSGLQYQSAGTIPDPYANNSAVQNAFAQLSLGSGQAFSDQPGANDTLYPGTYSSWNIKGNVTLEPGMYYVNGSISLGSQAALSGTGVTIVSSGQFSMTGGAALSLSAATTTTVSGGAIAGVVMADNSSSAATFTGNTTPALTGTLYFPNADVSFVGTAAGGSAGCLELIAQSVALTGNSGFAANCSTYGTANFSSDANLGPVALVQ